VILYSIEIVVRERRSTCWQESRGSAPRPFEGKSYTTRRQHLLAPYAPLESSFPSTNKPNCNRSCPWMTPRPPRSHRHFASQGRKSTISHQKTSLRSRGCDKRIRIHGPARLLLRNSAALPSSSAWLQRRIACRRRNRWRRGRLCGRLGAVESKRFGGSEECEEIHGTSSIRHSGKSFQGIGSTCITQLL